MIRTKLDTIKCPKGRFAGENDTMDAMGITNTYECVKSDH